MEEKNNTTVDVLENDGEFMLEPVPMSARRSTRSQFMVWIGFGICSNRSDHWRNFRWLWWNRRYATFTGNDGYYSWYGSIVSGYMFSWDCRTEKQD